MPAFHIPPSWSIDERLATPESTYLDRRQIVRALGLGAIGLAMPSLACAQQQPAGGAAGAGPSLRPAVGDGYDDLFPAPRNASYTIGDRKVTDATIEGSYNNYYEFTTAKDQVWRLAESYVARPWTIEVEGKVKKERTLDLDDVFRRFKLEERVYRFRCVERWAMQVPWTGFPLRALIDHCEPDPSARYVRFDTVLDKPKMPGVREQPWYPWPYTEALRLDEARHPLAFVAVGSYGKPMPMQHGAPLRLALPWKYGYKSVKSIVKIRFTKRRPGTFWNDLQPSEYGFYSNVEPHKPHPRWSQQWEQDIGTQETRKTLPYNGYEKEIGGLYDGSET
ncbi:MAG: protein-methionine-sulfoxide reductase catalytic subunit MsrP [Acidobacteriota bacterium]